MTCTMILDKDCGMMIQWRAPLGLLLDRLYEHPGLAPWAQIVRPGGPEVRRLILTSTLSLPLGTNAGWAGRDCHRLR